MDDRAVGPRGGDQRAAAHDLARPRRRAPRAARNSVGVSGSSRRRADACAAGSSTKLAGSALGGGAPGARRQQRVDADEQLGERERLGQVVVAAGVEAAEPVGERVARGEEQDRRCDAARPQRLADVAPVGVGQADVEHEDVGRRRRANARTASVPDAVARTLEALALERVAEDAAQLVVVLADADRGRDPGAAHRVTEGYAVGAALRSIGRSRVGSTRAACRRSPENTLNATAGRRRRPVRNAIPGPRRSTPPSPSASPPSRVRGRARSSTGTCPGRSASRTGAGSPRGSA